MTPVTNPLLGIMDSGISGNLVTGNYYSISTGTVTGSSVSSIVFSSIPQTFAHLEARITAKSAISTNDDNFYFRFNTDTSGSTSCNWHDFVSYNSGSVGGDSLTGQSNGFAARCTGSGSGSNSNQYGIGILFIADYTNPNKYKVTKSLVGHDDTSGVGYGGIASSVWQSFNAINQLTFYFPGFNTAVGSTVALYGVK